MAREGSSCKFTGTEDERGELVEAEVVEREQTVASYVMTPCAVNVHGAQEVLRLRCMELTHVVASLPLLVWNEASMLAPV